MPFHRKLGFAPRWRTARRGCDRAAEGSAGAAGEPPELPAEAHERHAVAPGEIGGGERRGGAHARRAFPPARALLRERVEEQHQVRAVLRVLDVDVRCAATRGRSPVDAADAVARRQRAKLGELDPLAPLARDLTAQDRPGAERRDDPAQPFDAGVDPHVGRVAQRSVDRRGPQPVARADDRGPDVVHAPALGREFEPQLSPPRRARARTIGSGRCRVARRRLKQRQRCASLLHRVSSQPLPSVRSAHTRRAARPVGGRRRARRRRDCRR